MESNEKTLTPDAETKASEEMKQANLKLKPKDKQELNDLCARLIELIPEFNTRNDCIPYIVKMAEKSIDMDSMRAESENTDEFFNAIEHIGNLYKAAITGKKEAIGQKDEDIRQLTASYKSKIEAMADQLEDLKNQLAAAEAKILQANNDRDKALEELHRMQDQAAVMANIQTTLKAMQEAQDNIVRMQAADGQLALYVPPVQNNTIS